MEQHIPVSLTNRMGNELVANDTPIDEEVLQIRLASGKGRLRHPAPQPHRASLTFNHHRVLGKISTANRCDTTPQFGLGYRRIQLQRLFAVVAENKRDLWAR